MSPAQLFISSITWYDDYAILLLPASKTDPFRLGMLLVIPKYAGHSFCQGAATWAASQGVNAKTIKHH
ncbi:hypothetical protein [Sporisorium scitamineum]|uniref:Uncharacterized protein n=1 Tax=Sporisorium scitamineum TaxID=49012 RepID=A0A0F7RZA7_9BASI|nr:hypothetical protein [Sporisorium scitamineum]